jgi:hypothetical protein
MPLYQFYCYKCHNPQEITMTLKKLDEYDRKERSISCPIKDESGNVCGEELTKIICPPKVVKVF